MPQPSVVGNDGVLINDASVGGVVGHGVRGRGRGGGGAGGGGGGAMAAAVRGRTLPRTEGRARICGVVRDTGKPNIRGTGSVSRPRTGTVVTGERGVTSCSNVGTSKRKDASHAGERAEDTRPAKRGRENGGNASDASNGGLQNAAQQQLRRRVGPTLRMAKNTGESKIPLVSRATLLPKPKVHVQPRASESRKSIIVSSCQTISTIENITPPKERSYLPTTSTPRIEDTLALTFSVSPVESVSADDIGKAVCFKTGTGVLRYYGYLEGREGMWCGVELSRPEGLNDGTDRGFRYFACPPSHGIMLPAHKVHWIQGNASDCSCNRTAIDFTLNDQKTERLMALNSAFTGAIADNTFTRESNVRSEATFEIEGVSLDTSKDTSGTTFVVGEATEKANGIATSVKTIITNESLDEKKKKVEEKNEKNCTLVLKNGSKEEGLASKTPSPVSQGKTFKITRLGSPGKLRKCFAIPKVVSPTRTTDGKLEKPHAEPNSVRTAVPLDDTFCKNTVSTTKRTVQSSKNVSPSANDTYEVWPKVKQSQTYSASYPSTDKISDITYNGTNDKGKGRVGDVTDLSGKRSIADLIANISPPPKPSGAVFALSDAFINEKPPRNKATLSALIPISTRVGISLPAKETSLVDERDCVHEKGLLKDEVSVENKAFDLVNTTYDLQAGAKAPCYEIPQERGSILTEEEMYVSFVDRRESMEQFLKGWIRGEELLEGSSPVDKKKNLGIGNEIEDLFKFENQANTMIGLNDKCRVSSTVGLFGVGYGTQRVDPVCSSIRESVGLASVFEDSKLSQIDAVSSSCLIDTTVSESYSLLGCAGGVEEEEEPTPPTTLPPSKVNPAPHYLMLNKQNSFEHDESLGILTPDQMTDFTVVLECSRSPSCENLTGSAGSRMALTRASASRPSDLPTSADGEPTEGSSERTPSPEELPLDPKPAESTEPMRTSVPMSFVTSVTSITSLEAGYQGDGENSRPASRSADLPPVVAPLPNLPAACRHDPMTDSDFFTESDADAHEEIVRGDRRAQVIDGTLFCAPGGRRCPSFMGEEMDSSGIYSDLDKRQDERHPEEAQSEDQTPDTVDTVSQKSQPSPDRLESAPVIMDCLQVPSCQIPLDSSLESNTTPTLELTVIEVNIENLPAKTLNKSDPIPLKKYKMPKRNVVSKIKAMIESGPKDEAEKEARRPPRTPRKGGRWDAVMSKIEAGKTEQRSRPPRKDVKSRVLESLGSSPPIISRRLTSGDCGNKSKRRTRGRQDVNSPTRETAHSSVHSSMSDLSSSLRSAKKRLGSPGGSEGSVQSTPRISSPRQQQPPSSLTITNSSPGTTVTTNNNNVISSNQNNNNNNNNSNGSNNNHSHHRTPSLSQRSPNTANPPRRLANARNNQQQTRIGNSEVKKSSLDVSKINLEKSPSTTRKAAVSRRLPMKLQTPVPIKDRPAKETTNTAAARNSVEARDRADQTEPTYETLQVRQAEVSVQALSVIVQYLAHQLDGFSAPKLKKDCERMKTEWLAARVEIEELNAKHLRIEKRLNDERKDHRKTLDQLRADLEARHAERVAELEAALQEERDKFETRLHESLSESTKEHQTAIARLRAEHEADLIRREAETDRRSVVHDQGAVLRAEVQSLRSVLELRSQEIAALRSEIDGFKREIEAKEALEQRAEILEARCEDLVAQLQRKESFERQLSHENNVLLQSFRQESKQKKRLSQQNEELQWRLRQNNEVVTVLANQLATPPQRHSRSLGPETLSHHAHSPDDSPPASPMVKSMVEKSDSVSWTLEIEETPEAMASRLLRRSGSTCRGISPSDSRPKRSKQPLSAPAAVTVSRQSSLRSTPQRAVVLRTRSKSVSVSDPGPKETSWTPGFNPTPVAPLRRRPRSDPAASPIVAVENNSGPRPQEAGGEAMISEETSASSSEDESSASSDLPRLAMEFSWSESEG